MAPRRQWHELARLYGVQTSYTDVRGRRRRASREALLRVLAALGAPVDSDRGVEEAMRWRRRETWERLCEPVLVAWDGRLRHVEVRLPERLAAAPVRVLLEEEETGARREWSCDPGRLPTAGLAEIDGVGFVAKRLPGFERLPIGYHRLRVESEAGAAEALVICAPERAYSPAEGAPGATGWGVLAPMYAIHSARSLGAGDLADFERLWRWTASLGGRVVATLPLLATYLDEPFDPSPYAPVSRLFWNEFYIALDRVAGLAECAEARVLLASASSQQQIARWRQAPEVDYRGQMALRRRVLDLLAEHCFRQAPARWEAVRRHAASRPAVEDYAQFRAVGERRALPWPQWPDRLRQGRIEPGDYDPRAFRYHLFVQWIMHEQLGELGRKLRREGPGLYLDLPLGVHRLGYDAWRNAELFAPGLSGGAPPDSFFTQGQDWDFAPLHPDRSRAQGHRYFIDCLRHHLAQAGILRIDHVMGLHRLFCIPRGMPPTSGLYVRYPSEELYAIVSLESHRSRSVIVGENLGTVPASVNAAMRRHALRRTYVAQYELRPRAAEALAPPERQTAATLNTHDMPPWAAFWQGADLDDLHALGLFDASAVAAEHARRAAVRQALLQWLRATGSLRGDVDSPEDVRDAVIGWLAASRAEWLIVNLEDLWLETRPQNTPGTTTERPNWRRKFRHALESLCREPRLRDLLQTVDRLRRQGDGPPSAQEAKDS